MQHLDRLCPSDLCGGGERPPALALRRLPPPRPVQRQLHSLRRRQEVDRSLTQMHHGNVRIRIDIFVPFSLFFFVLKLRDFFYSKYL